MPSSTRHPMARLSVGLLTALAIGLSAPAAALAKDVSAAAGTSCVNVIGAPWQLKGHGSGTHYTIEIHGLPCSLAVKWVPKLTSQRGGFATPLKGPAGFKCIAVWASRLAAAGNCSRGQLNFSWGQKAAR
jgi:hypothetical protein